LEGKGRHCRLMVGHLRLRGRKLLAFKCLSFVPLGIG
jgi:hypothetical protein